MLETPPTRGVATVLIVGALAALRSWANCSKVKEDGLVVRPRLGSSSSGARSPVLARSPAILGRVGAEIGGGLGSGEKRRRLRLSSEAGADDEDDVDSGVSPSVMW